MKPKVLIIEDEIRFAQLIYLELRHEGYDAEVISDGIQAMDTIHSQAFDAILLDYMLPGMNGSEVCKETRRFSSVPIIAVTALDDARETMIQSGANHCLLKPFDIQELLDLLHQYHPDTDAEDTAC